jgi:hypothetical protein
MKRLLTYLLFFQSISLSSAAITVQIDYRFDGSGFFTNPVARAALEIGINNISSRLLDTLEPITPGPTPFGFSNNFDLKINNPSTGLPVTVNNMAIARDTLVVFVGTRDLPAGTLGVGGPGGYGGSGLPEFLDNIETRGEGNTTGPSAVDFAPWGGTIAFDSLTSWSFGTTTADPGGSLNSFISVVEHEFGHLLGIGTAPSWQARILSSPAGLEFTGLASTDAFGGYVPLANEAHWAEGTQGKILGVLQEAAMDPSITLGTRKQFTKLDFAALYDIGWEVTGIPEASPGLLLGFALPILGFWARRQRLG